MPSLTGIQIYKLQVIQPRLLNDTTIQPRLLSAQQTTQLHSLFGLFAQFMNVTQFENSKSFHKHQFPTLHC